MKNTNIVIIGMIHQHMIHFMKCRILRFPGSGELCVHHGQNCANCISNIASVRRNTLTTNFEVDQTVAKSTIAMQMFVKRNYV